MLCQKIIRKYLLATPTTELYSSGKENNNTTKTDIENKIDNESPLQSQEPSYGMLVKPPAFHHILAMAFACVLSSQLKVFFCQQPWPRPLAHCCFGKLSSQPSWCGDQQANVLARGYSTQKAVWNNALMCQVWKSCQGKDVWSDPTVCHLLSARTKHEVLSSEGMVETSAFLCGSWSPGRWLGCLGHSSSGVIAERVGQNIDWNTFFFSFLSLQYLVRLVISLYTLYLPKLTESQ